MARVTPADVKAILDTDIDLDPYITLAHRVVQNNLLDCGYSDADLKEIERWLAAHFAFVAPSVGFGGGITSKSEGNLSVSFGGDFGKNLASSNYGQTAMLFDSCGVLSQLGKRRATFNVL